MDTFKVYEYNGTDWNLIKDDIEGYASITQNFNGELCLVYYTEEDSVKKIKLLFSLDRGETWEGEITIDDTDIVECQPEIIQDFNGQLIVFYLKNVLNPSSSEKEKALVYKVSYTRGQTWSDSIVIAYLGS